MTRRRVIQAEPRVDFRAVHAWFGAAVGERFGSSELLLHALAFANGDLASPVEAMLAREPDVKHPKYSGVSIDWFVEESSRLRSGIRDLLKMAMGGDPKAFAAQVAHDHAEALQGVTLHPQFALSSGCAYRVEFASDQDVLAYVAFLLCDDNRGFRKDLCQCRLETCRRFFLVQKPPSGGRPRREYCSTEHMEEAHASQSTARAQKSRANKAKKSRKSK